MKCVKWPSHYSVWTLPMPAYDDFLSFAVIRWCTSAARREVGERAFRARCHTHSYVGARSVRREILCMHKNSLRRPTYGPYAASTLCERSACSLRVKRTLTERPQHADAGGHKMCQFHACPLRVGSKFWTFLQHMVCVHSTYAYRIQIVSALLSVFIVRSHRMHWYN